MTQQRIRILNEITINQIAAGEVIENPASVVKELVENAIDSGATHIYVETKAGGRGQIKVTDDGCGMNQDDLILSVERHSTSKIKEVEELNSLFTLGFRGEALASIASVSKMSLHSASANGEGNFLQIEGGKVVAFRPLAKSQGTSVEVKSIFFNIPVRKKFQKTLAWDTSEIYRVLTKFILSYPLLGFTWINDEKKRLEFISSDNLENRIKALLGEDFLINSVPLEHKQNNIFLKGYISRPTYHRPNRTGQFLFINQRSVTSSFIANKVLESYGTRLSQHRYPLFVLLLSLPPSWIDVNVHPQKKEIRMREEEKLSSFILEAIESALEERKKMIAFPEITQITQTHPLKFMAAEAITNYQALKEESDLFISKVNVIGKIGRYFLLQHEEGIQIIDVIRATERVLFEELTSVHHKKEMQTLLIPIQLTISNKDKILLDEHLDGLNASGISIRHFGGNTYIIDAIPALLESTEIQDLIYAYLEEGQFPCHLNKCLKTKIPSLHMGIAIIEKLLKCHNYELTPNGEKISLFLDENFFEKIL